MAILIGLCAFAATLLGGFFALRFKDKLHLILGFSAGAVLGVAFFDLLPEAISLGSKVYNVATVLACTAAGYFFFMVLDRLVMSRTYEQEEGSRQKRGVLGAGSLTLHSFLDGAAIGLAFQVSNVVGVIVATAVLVHDFSDGINTVNLVLKNGGAHKDARKWLVVDAIAPVLGVVSTLFFTLPEQTLGIILAMFSGFFLYIGASDLLPESYHGRPTRWTTIATLLGAGVLFAAIHFAR